MALQFHKNLYFYTPFHEFTFCSERTKTIQKKSPLCFEVTRCNNADIFLL